MKMHHVLLTPQDINSWTGDRKHYRFDAERSLRVLGYGGGVGGCVKKKSPVMAREGTVEGHAVGVSKLVKTVQNVSTFRSGTVEYSVVPDVCIQA